MECRVGYSRLAFQSRILRGADWLPASSSVRAPKPSSTGRYLIKFHQPQVRVQVATPSKLSPAKSSSTKVEIEGPSTNLSVIFQRLQRLVLPYWVECPDARWRLAGVVGLTLATTGVSVVFSYLGRDFYNALSERDVPGFRLMIIRYLAGFVLGIPVFVYSDYLQGFLCPSTIAATARNTSKDHVTFNYLGRDFYNAISEKNVDAFHLQLLKYLGGFCVGIPVYVFKGYYQSRLALEWREWLTSHLLSKYFADKSFYQLQAGALVDNPDQRIAADVRQFTDAALGLSLTVLNSLIDLVSFSGILYSIYPPLFAALLAYSVGGTVGSIALGKSLVGLNFNQEAVEADLRYGLVRVRENAESIAFYGGQSNEMAALMQRLQAVVRNYSKLLIASRNLDFFTSFYRFLIQLLPAAVVAPLFFAGKIEFGVITQSSSAFNHILNDVSLVVYQFDTLAGFSAVIDRLGEFQEVVDVKLRHSHPRVKKQRAAAASLAAAVATASASATSSEDSTDSLKQQAEATGTAAAIPSAAAAGGGDRVGTSNQLTVSADQISSTSTVDQSQQPTAAAGTGLGAPGIQVVYVMPDQNGSSTSSRRDQADELLLELDGVSINTPDGSLALVQDLSIKVHAGDTLLIMGPSGAGKTSVLRTLAGLWQAGSGTIYSYGLAGLGDPGVNTQGRNNVLFLPQKPYMVLGSLRDQLLYPTWTQKAATAGDGLPGGYGKAGSNDGNGRGAHSSTDREVPTDQQLEAMLQTVQLGQLIQRCKSSMAAAAEADVAAEPQHHTTPTNSTPTVTATSSPHAVLHNVSSSARDKDRNKSQNPAVSAAGSGDVSALDHVADWSGMLSLGEQQRLAFARLLLAAPRLALLDEATSALDTKNEELLYKALMERGTTVISVGHRPNLVLYHRQVLQLGASQGAVPGKWQVVPAQQLMASAKSY